MFGENPEPKDMSSRNWIAYLFSSFVINIVGLNLLISVIGDNFSKVNAKLNAIDCKSRLSEILKIEKDIRKMDSEAA